MIQINFKLIFSSHSRSQDVFVCSKLWNTHHRPDLVRKALKQTLAHLQLAYLDLYLIHWPTAYQEDGDLFPKDADDNLIFSNVDYTDTWSEMERLVDDGLVRNIGVSNFNRAQLDRVLAMARIRPVINQIECHPYLTQDKLSRYCASKGVVVTAYSPLGSPQRPWAKAGDPVLLEEKALREIGAKYGKSTAQVLIRYQLQRGHVVIPKSVTKHRIASNFDVFDFVLDKHDIEAINSFDCSGRLCPLAGYVFSINFYSENCEFKKILFSLSHENHPHFPFKDEY